MKYFYEFIGTFFLVFAVGMSVLEPNSLGNFAPLAIGSALAVMVYAGGHLSGAHYNPAISFSVFLRGKLSWKELIGYWVVQWAAAIVAALITIKLKKGYPETTMMNLEVVPTLVCEFIFTFALCYVVLNTATAKETKGNSYFGFAIGFTVLAGAYLVGAISGGAFNPAVALGITILNITSWPNIWLFFLANFVGGACAAWVFREAHKQSL